MESLRRWVNGLWVGMALVIYPLMFHVAFEPSPDNYAIVLVITSDTNQTPYFQYDEVPILTDDQASLDIPRHHLPHGGYHITTQLMRWVDNELVLVDAADTLIVVH